MNNVIMISLCLITGALFGVFATMVGLVLVEDLLIKKEQKESDR